jgi:hypothetical protein
VSRNSAGFERYKSGLKSQLLFEDFPGGTRDDGRGGSGELSRETVARDEQPCKAGESGTFHWGLPEL